MSTSAPPQSLRSAATAAMRKHGFEPEFSAEVMAEVRSLDDPSDDPLARGVKDLRHLLWSSIDNRQSRDLDQIEAAERLSDDSIRVLIGVADVDTLVQLGSAADEHAAANTTSVYTGVAIFPMLPERLSTDLTSLNEGEDRLAVVIQFEVTSGGEITNASVYRALVHNRAKLTYDAIGMWLEEKGPAPPAIAGSRELEKQVRLQDEAAQRLRLARVVAGALNFESIEASPVVVNGRVVDLAVARRNRARDLIEDFMVAANRSVAMYLIERGSASLRRVVREPKRWDRIVAIAADFGEALPEKPDSVALSEFLAKRRAADPEHFADLSLSVVKLLGPGIYVLERRLGNRREAGHFGLAVAEYVHSTAPNRRFADLVTQRMLRAATTGGAPPYSDAELIEIAARCTERGEAARKVERTMRKVAGASMLAERVGESFTAVITASSPKGIYARILSPPVEGRVVRGGRNLDVGDTVSLKLVVSDPVRGYIDFAHEADGAERRLARSRRKKQAADRLRPRIGQMFDAEVTGVSDSGTYVRLADGSAEGRVVRGYKPLSVGMKVPVKLVGTDSVHGFIDFEYSMGVAPAKDDRQQRKRAAALALRDRVGDNFRAVVSGTSRKATWITLVPDGTEGRLVRGRSGLTVGSEIGVVLLAADPARGFIDFAREDTVLPATGSEGIRRDEAMVEPPRRAKPDNAESRRADMHSIGQVHLASAIVALAAGAWIVWRPKGTAMHQRVGWLYAASMLTLNVTALMIYRLTGTFGPFHIAALLSLVTLIAGIVPAWRRRPVNWLDQHYFWMAYSYLGLLAATVAETATRVPAVQAFAGGPSPVFWVVVVVSSIAVFVVGGRVIRQRFEGTTRPFRTSASAHTGL